jgi:diguanylate cyclase (GGDEF)-like protein
MENRLTEGKESSTRSTVEVAYGIIASLDRQVGRGEINRDEAQKRAKDMIKDIRYHEREYFWINDLEPRMVMHPNVPDLDGKNLSEFKDPNGKHLFMEFVKVAKNSGGGFVSYMWPKPGEKAPVPKVSYVKLYQPWGWIVGSGIYLDDMQADIGRLRLISSAGAVLFAIMTLTMAYLVGGGVTKRLARVIGGLREIASGKGDVDLTKRISITSIDEIGVLSTEFNGLMESINRLTIFKKVIEEDETIEDVYARLWRVFTNELKLENCIIYEVDLIHNRMQAVFPVGIEEGSVPCGSEIFDNAELCKARRTGHMINSVDFPAICRHFRQGESKEHYCIPMTIGGGTVGVVQFLLPTHSTPAQRNMYERHVYKAEQYIKESLPVLEAKRLMQTLRESALVDPLTGLHNRRFLQESVENLCAAAKRRGKLIGLLMCDLDYFKQVNDTHGHAAGDKILQQTAHAIRSAVREADLVIRFGGEEFLIVLLDIKESEALVVAEKIRDRVFQTRFRLEGDQVLQKTISIGACEYPSDCDTFWQAIKYADVAMYRSKEEGRNRCTRFTADMWMGGQI